MKKFIYLAVTAALFMCVSCKEDHTTPINEIAKSCFVPGGDNTYWDYIDLRQSGDNRNFTVAVSDYTEFQNACDEKKVYSEQITFKIGGKECSVYSNSCTEDGTAVIQMSIPHSEVALCLKCDANGVYDCDSSAYLATYTGLNETFKKVHYFGVKSGTDYYHYYYAEGVGLIYMYDEQQKVCLKLSGYVIH